MTLNPPGVELPFFYTGGAGGGIKHSLVIMGDIRDQSVATNIRMEWLGQ